MPNIPRVSTGLKGLDKVLSGGIPAGSINLLSGACGTGKSTFAMQFLYEGAKYHNEPGVYVTLEEHPDKLIENMSLFGWDLKDMIAKKRILVIKPEIYKFETIKQVLRDAIEKIGAKRLVVDSYSVLLTYFSDPYEIRNGLVQLDREIKKMDCTALIISDIKDNSEIFSTTGVEEFIVDGVIVLYLLKSHGHPFESERALSIRKMRATNHPLKTYPFHITSGGIAMQGSHLTGPLPGSLTSQPETDHMSVTNEPPRLAPEERKHKKKIKSKPEKQEKKPKGKTKPKMIEVSNLKAAESKGKHSWRWKYL